MAKPLLPETLWQAIEPLLPAQKLSPKGGRPPIGNKEARTGILFVLLTGCPWEYLPQEMGCGSGMTCGRRLRHWQQAGIWHKLHLALLQQLSYADLIDWSRVSVDASNVPAPKGGSPPALIPPTGAKRAARSPRHRPAGHSLGGANGGGQPKRNDAVFGNHRCPADAGS